MLPVFVLVTVVEVEVVSRGFTLESFPLKPLNVAHMITDAALP